MTSDRPSSRRACALWLAGALLLAPRGARAATTPDAGSAADVTPNVDPNVVAAVAAPASAEARAPSPEVAREAAALVTTGMKLFDAGAWDEAASAFERAHALVATPKLLYNVGHARARAGHTLAARDAFAGFLAAPDLGDTKQRHRAEELRAELEGKLAAVELDVEGAAGVVVWVDGIPRARSPIAGPIWVDPGIRQIELAVPGRPLRTETLTLAAGARVRLSLAPAPEVAEAAGPPPPRSTPAPKLLAAPRRSARPSWSRPD